MFAQCFVRDFSLLVESPPCLSEQNVKRGSIWYVCHSLEHFDNSRMEIQMEMILGLLTDLLVWVVLIALLLFSVWNYRYGFLRASRLALLLLLLAGGIYILFHNSMILVYSVPAACLMIFLSFLVPISRKTKMIVDSDTRHDERDITFARHRLKPGSADYKDYYERHPEKVENDKKTRNLPGLCAERSSFFNRLNAAATGASFFLLGSLRNAVDGPVSEIKHASPEAITNFLRALSKHYGACCFGTAKINSKHYYSHVGRGEGQYGSEIPAVHSYAIVIGSEMKPGFTGTAPLSPEVVEVGRRYVDCAVRAIEIAAVVRSMGYSAKAHIDGNYKVVVPLVANEAKIGGFGWSNLFLTKKYGPRVRYSVVTTDMEIPAAEGIPPDFIPFCSICRKCAVNCPSRSINPKKPDKINADRCYMYWNSVGTDCGKCIAVCPMGHPWGPLKSLALRSATGAHLLKTLDDAFYGKKPESLKLSSWMGN